MQQHVSGSVLPAGDSWVDVIEVGTRDGLQIETTLVPAAQKIAILNAMIASGILHIEVTSFVSPKAVPQLADASEVLAGIARRDDTFLMALIPNVKGAERAALTSLDGGVLLCSASETHNRKNLNRSIADTISGFGPVVECLHQAGILLDDRQGRELSGAQVVLGKPTDQVLEQLELRTPYGVTDQVVQGRIQRRTPLGGVGQGQVGVGDVGRLGH